MNPINSITKLFVLIILSAIVLIAASSPLYAAKGRKNSSKMKQTKLWQQVDESSLKLNKQRLDEKRSGLPEKYLLFRLNQASLKSALAKLPLENTDAARNESVVMEIPQPDGTIERFRMEETPVLSAELAAQYPTWKTFVGYGIDDPKAVGRFDWNILGFHGYIETAKGTVLIDPYQKGDTKNYLVFYKHEYGKSDNEFFCKVNNTMSKIIKTDYQSFAPSAPEFSFGATVRTYKLAVATTGEWSRNAAGYTAGQPAQTTRDNALAVVVTSVNRLIGIYIRELASSFQLVNPATNSANNIIFDDPATDPYNNTDNVAQLPINQTTLDTRVGIANYDIGHLYGTGGGGVASTPSLCSSQKAEGYSARGTDTGDPFTVDYVAHEIGHQFGSDHTYNNVDPSGTCTTRSAIDAFEVGSGATIMSYVGICADRNLQQYVDTGFPSFHIRSMTTINTNLTTGDPATTGCGTTSGTNAVPTVSGGGDFTIPRLTPFTVTATGNDADATDVPNLLYSWEEYDLAPSASGAVGTPAGTYDVDNDGVLRPLLRPYSPIASNSRTFPSLTFILNPTNNDATADVGGVRGNQPVLTYTGTHPTGFPGAVCETGMTCVVGERLPTVSRTMTFRVSLRDRRGGVADAPQTVIIAGAAGPFQITTQNSSPVTWQAGTPQTVTWDVAGSNAAPVNAANVNILLSTDGGQTFPITLAANTPNDGTEQITVPSNPTTTARIRVEGAGNIFFDINNANFTINQVAVSYEADVATRPSGDGAVLSNDVVQIRRFLNGTNTPDPMTNEFQRADSSPFADKGDGLLNSADVVQTRRYQNGTSPLQTAGGPTLPNRPQALTDEFNKTEAQSKSPKGNQGEVRVESTTTSAGQTVTVNIRVDAVGDEAEYGFIINYNTNVLSNPVIRQGKTGASVRSCNTTTKLGQISCSVGGFPNNQMSSSDVGIGEIAAGNNQILITVTFTRAAMSPPGTTPLTLSNVNASSDAPQLFTPTATNGMVTILAPTAAASEISRRVVTSNGRGVFRARVILTDQNGETRSALKNPFGYYRFDDGAAGQTYIFNVSHKRYQFSPRVVSIVEDLGEFDFIAIN